MDYDRSYACSLVIVIGHWCKVEGTIAVTVLISITQQAVITIFPSYTTFESNRKVSARIGRKRSHRVEDINSAQEAISIILGSLDLQNLLKTKLFDHNGFHF